MRNERLGGRNTQLLFRIKRRLGTHRGFFAILENNKAGITRTGFVVFGFDGESGGAVNKAENLLKDLVCSFLGETVLNLHTTL